MSAWEASTFDGETDAERRQLAGSDDVACLPLGDKGEQSQRITLGKMLADRRDRVFDLEIGGQPVRLLLNRGDQVQRAYRWTLRAMPEV